MAFCRGLRHRSEMDTQSLGTLMRALTFAAGKHRDQRRKDIPASPYINHPLAVVDILVNEGEVTDIAILCAAALHDTIEDTATTADELRIHFGATVATLVAEVTDDKSLEKAVRKQHQIDHAPHLPAAAKIIKLADKISNVRDILSSPPPDWSVQRRSDYIAWAQRVVHGLQDAHPTLAATFDRTVQGSSRG
jgi:GTP diphosphokinase / guanosine-3',5'-bis(diphosphate) 3'-diphosphatase